MSKETLISKGDSCGSLQAGAQALANAANIPMLEGLDINTLKKALKDPELKHCSSSSYIFST